MIRIEAVEFSYPQGEFSLSIPQMSVAQGEKVAVIGPSGSGKTTLLNLVAGIITPQRGKVSVADMEVSSSSDAKRRDFRISNIGFVFQDFGLLDYLNVLDNILHPYRITRALNLTREVQQRAIDLADGLGIGDRLKHHAGELSQGEQQRAAICRALLPQPGLILADEATGNLDPRNKGKILDLLFDSVDSSEATLLAVTHDHDLLSRFDRVIDFLDYRNEGAS
ncbi:MAG: ABC transporter ATP-binding protein [Thiotrichales bacterium]|nr:MAG: ABC transporter ATP-binding protein [Thiotrichales bacterium]